VPGNTSHAANDATRPVIGSRLTTAADLLTNDSIEGLHKRYRCDVHHATRVSSYNL